MKKLPAILLLTLVCSTRSMQQPDFITAPQQPDTWLIRKINTIINWLEKKRDNAIKSEQKKVRDNRLLQQASTNEKKLMQLLSHSKITPLISIVMLAANTGLAWAAKDTCSRQKTCAVSCIGGLFCLLNLSRHYHNQSFIKEYAKLKAAHSLYSSLYPSFLNTDCQSKIKILEHVKRMLQKNIRTNAIFKNINSLGTSGSILGLGSMLPAISANNNHICPQLFALQCATNGIAAWMHARKITNHNKKINKEIQTINRMLESLQIPPAGTTILNNQNHINQNDLSASAPPLDK